MKLTAQLRLLPTEEQSAAIATQIRQFAAAATEAARIGREAGAFTRASLHHAAYRVLRESMQLSSFVADNAVKAAAHVFTRDRTARPKFRANSMTINGGRYSFTFRPDDTLSIRVGGSRMILPFVCGMRQRAMLLTRTCYASLLQRDGKTFLHVTCNVAEDPTIAVQRFVGIDLGIANVATTSDGETFTGDAIESTRVRHAERRRRLNREATRQRKRGLRPKNVRRALKRRGRRESQFRRDVNHCITKQVVALAQGTKRGIAVEDLNGIRSRIRFAKSQRARMGSWAFAQWQAFCAYKAQRAGVPYVVVNAAYTSQTCHVCAVVDKASRLDQARFVCTACGHTAHADVNAAQNIAARARVEAPMVAESPQEIAA